MKNNPNETKESRSLTAENLPDNPRSPNFLTRKQVAARWSVTTHTVARRKDLKPVRFNRRLLRYRLEDVVALEN